MLYIFQYHLPINPINYYVLHKKSLYELQNINRIENLLYK